MNDPSRQLAQYLESQRATSASLLERLRRAQRADGGLPAEGFDDASGAWPTAQALASVLWLRLLPPESSFVEGLCSWLRAHQNPDGGWPFRGHGESFADTTAWAVWGLSLYGPSAVDELLRGIAWLLEAQQNTATGQRGGWGVHPRERDRVYSTFASLLALHGALRVDSVRQSPLASAVLDAVTEGIDWLKRARNPDGGWGIHEGTQSDLANSCHGELALTLAGGRPLGDGAAVLAVLREVRLPSGTWPTVTEIFELSSGLDLRLSWFTTPYCAWLTSLCWDAGLVPAEAAVDATAAIARFIGPDGSVALNPDGTDLRSWPICDALLGIHGFLAVAERHRKALMEALDTRSRAERDRERKEVLDLARQRYPFTIAMPLHAYLRSSRSSGERLSVLLTLFEASIRYLSSVAAALYIQSREEAEAVDGVLREGIRRPSLGFWWTLLGQICRLNLRTSAPYQFLDDVFDNVLAPAHGGARLSDQCQKLIKLRNRTRGHGAAEFLSTSDVTRLAVEAEETVMSLLGAIRFLANYDSFFIIDSSFDEFEGLETYRIKSCKGFDAFFDESVLRTSARLSRALPNIDVRYFYFQDRNAATAVNLYPFVVFGECPECRRETVLSYNSLVDTRTEYLAYQCGHVGGQEASEPFLRRLARWL